MREVPCLFFNKNWKIWLMKRIVWQESYELNTDQKIWHYKGSSTAYPYDIVIGREVNCGISRKCRSFDRVLWGKEKKRKRERKKERKREKKRVGESIKNIWINSLAIKGLLDNLKEWGIINKRQLDYFKWVVKQTEMILHEGLGRTVSLYT